MVSPQLPKVAQSIKVFCKKCDLDRSHRVLAHMDSVTAKLQCETCQCKQNYKLPQPGVRKVSTVSGPRVQGATRGSPAARSSTAAATWLTYQNANSTRDAKPYAPSMLFAKGDVVSHGMFGIGFVTSSTSSKIEVVFQEGTKALIHNQKTASV